MWFIAHRGLVTNKTKENTIEAFNKALDSSKYKGIELDIRTTKDKQFVVYHDILFKGKMINNTLYKDLKKYDIPKLIDVLKLNTNKIIMVEVKDFNIDIRRLAKLLNKFNNKNLYVSSFNNEVLLKIKPFLKKVKIGSLNYLLNSLENYEIFDFICIINYLLTDDLVKYFQKNNIEIFSYGIKKRTNIKYKNVYYIIDEKILN